MALRALGSGAAGFDSDIADAFRYAGANGARVVNASFGAPGASQTLRAAIHAYPATLFVVSSGNSGADNDATPIYPCNTPEPNVVCVGATTDSDQRASYSNFGRRSVDVFAPGDRILTTTRVSDGFYENLVYGFGTSFATPHVAATAALLLQVEPTLTAEELKEILLDTSETLADHRFAAISVSGGRLNANDAVHLAQTFFTTEIPDNDGDGWVDRADACPTTKVVGSPDGCPLDDDWDGKVNAVDNCDLDPNPGQQDGDRDGIGDACDPDWDNDRVLNVRDNCSTTYNPTQANRDGDRLGDACDSDRDGDGRLNVNDRCPDTKAFTANGCPPPTPPPPTVLDRDHDGRIDASDGCPTEPALTNDGCPLPVVAALTPKARKPTATVKVVTSRPATARITIQRKRVRRWVRVARKERVTSDNHVTVRVKGLHRGRHRAVVVLSSGAGSAPAATQRFRVR
jgi:subtilisin family serine protease